MEAEATNPSTPLQVDDAEVASSGAADSNSAVVGADNAGTAESSDLKSSRFLCVGTRGDLTFYAHLSSGLVDSHTLARIMVGLYEEKIRRRALADRESFVLISAEVVSAEIGDPWVAKLVEPENPQERPTRHVSLQLLGVRHMVFFAKPFTAEHLLTNFLALCETVGDDGDLTLVDAVWSDNNPAERLAHTEKNRDAPGPLKLRPFASLVAKALGRCAYSPICWHPSARFIRHFDPEIYRG